MRLLLLTVSCALLLSACNKDDAAITKCESYMQYKTQSYQSSCACIINAAKENQVKDVNGFLSVLWDTKRVERLLTSDLFNQNAGAINTSHINAIKDVVENCPLNDPQPDTRPLLMTFNGVFNGVVDGNFVCMTKNDSQTEVQPYLYQHLTLVGLTPMIAARVKNVHVKYAMKDAITNNEKTFADLDKSLPKDKRLLLLSAFNIDFSRAFFYYKNVEHQSAQDAIDNAYSQAYTNLIKLIANNAEQVTAYLASSFEFYKTPAAIEKGCIPMNAPAIVEALKAE